MRASDTFADGVSVSFSSGEKAGMRASNASANGANFQHLSCDLFCSHSSALLNPSSIRHTIGVSVSFSSGEKAGMRASNTFASGANSQLQRSDIFVEPNPKKY